MSVVGIDFGNDLSVIALARRGGIDVVANEVSKRETPSVVSFGEKERGIGEAGLTNAVSNWKNTINQVKRFIGLKYNSAQVQKEIKNVAYKVVEREDGGVGFEVMYRNEKKVFTPEAIVAMLLTKFKHFAELENGGVRIVDCVVSVPTHFTDAQRRAMLAACQIAGMNCLRLMNDTTAAALYYGIFKQDFPATEPVNVALVDIGHSQTTVSIVAFTQGKLQVLAHASDRDIGARNFDMLLTDYFIEEIKKKYKMDVTTNPKALVRLRAACEKLKKVLSANAQAPLNIECLMEDKDISFLFERSQLEEMAQPLLPKFAAVAQRAIEISGLSLDKISTVEVIGGGVRIPMLRDVFEKAFGGKKLFTTLNASEAIGRGCAIQAAMLSPSFKVKDFSVTDTTSYPIAVGWNTSAQQQQNDQQVEEMDVDGSAPAGLKITKRATLFKIGDPFPATKMLKFNRSEGFELYSFYETSDLLPEGANQLISKFVVAGPQPTLPEPTQIKVKIKMNLHGITSIESAQMQEEIEVIEEPKPASPTKPASPATAAEGDAAAPAAPAPAAEQQPQEPIKKKVKRNIDIPVHTNYVEGLDATTIQKLNEEEFNMQLNDRVVAETADRKNAVEAYIYDMRNKVSEGGELAEYMTEDSRNQFLDALNATENWLYDEGYDATKSVYIDRLAQLQKHGDPVVRRHIEASTRPIAADELQNALKQSRATATSLDEKYSHIEQVERDKVLAKADEIEQWFNDKNAQQQALPKHADAVILTSDLRKKKQELETLTAQVMNKPKPKPQPKPAEAQSPKPASPTTEGAAATAAEGENNKGPAPMQEESTNSNNNNNNTEQQQQQQQQGQMDLD